jgi:23S rRNA (pseudouridine1915-N3)-methyltransferase
LLDETGKQLDSPALTRLIEECQLRSRPITIVIGGAYGVTTELMERADIVLSLSKLVFPHQLVRLIIAEQLYRCQEISRGSGYHHA